MFWSRMLSPSTTGVDSDIFVANSKKGSVGVGARSPRDRCFVPQYREEVAIQRRGHSAEVVVCLEGSSPEIQPGLRTGLRISVAVTVVGVTELLAIASLRLRKERNLSECTLEVRWGCEDRWKRINKMEVV